MISEFTLFIFTTFAGLAAGTYIMSAVFPKEAEGRHPWVFPVAMLVLLGIGLLGCLGHLQHPERFMNALWNPLAGITQEAYLSILFGSAVAVDAVICIRRNSASRTVRLIGAVFGFLLTFAMGYAYSSTGGVPAWSTPVTIPFFVVGDLAMGAAFWAVLKRGSYTGRSYVTTTVVIELVLVCTLAMMAVHFSGLGFGVLVFVAAIFLAPVAHTVLSWVARSGNREWVVYAAFVCVLVGVMIARYAFYAAYMV